MDNKQDIKFSVARLENLKQATILDSLSSINLDNDIDLYDTMINLFVKGKLDNDFSSLIFQDMTDEEKKKVFELAKEYMPLCFFEGDFNYWTDSVEGLSLRNLDYICMRIFDNYDFLLGLASEGKIDVLEQLKSMQKTGAFTDKVIIDYLRTVFNDDNLLKEVLSNFVDNDSEYSNLSVKDKSLLLINPEGVLYDKGVSDKIIDDLKLKKKIIDYSNISIDPNAISLNELIQKIGNNSYREILLDIYMDYMMNINNFDLEKNNKLFH